MYRAAWQYPTKIALPILAGQFLYDWVSNGLAPAVQHLPLKLCVLFVVVVGWAGYATWRRRRKQAVR